MLVSRQTGSHCRLSIRLSPILALRRMSDLGCDFNRSMQHLISHYREEAVEESRRGRRSYKKDDRSSLLGFLLQYDVDAAGFDEVPRLPFVQLGDNLLHRPRHGLEAPFSAAVNGVGAIKRDYVTIPVGACPAARRLCSPDRYDLVGLYD